MYIFTLEKKLIDDPELSDPLNIGAIPKYYYISRIDEYDLEYTFDEKDGGELERMLITLMLEFYDRKNS